MLSKKNIAVFGAGAIGSLIANFIQNQGLKVTLYGRFNSALGTSSKSCKVIYFHGNELVETPVESSPPSQNSIDIAIITVKAFDVETTLEQVQPYLAVGSHVIISHNGMGTIQCLQAHSRSSFGYFCSLTSGATKQGCHVYPKGTGPSFLQLVSAPTNFEKSSAQPYRALNFDELRALFPHLRQTEDLNQILWEKLAINCVINPITAINKVKNGQVLSPDHTELITQLHQEISEVAHREGITLNLDDLTASLIAVASSTSENNSSMLQDVLLGRKTEIDYINGYVLRKAKQHNVPAPANQQMFDLVSNLSFTTAK